MHKKILIVDDEPQIRKFLKKALLVLGYDAEDGVNGEHALQVLKEHQPDLILLDLGLPDIDGQDLLVLIREKYNTPIIVISARSESHEIVKALENGANDYVKKPFDMPELLARIKKCLLASSNLGCTIDSENKTYNFGNMTVAIHNREVKIDNNPVKLSKKEFVLLSLFVRHAGKLITQTQIFKEVWGEYYNDDPQYLRVYIRQLRVKLEECSIQPLIVTESGVGYRFVEESKIEK
ncbi:response regulator transcription factor [Francisellaceae bacterium]|nr:response regulator transcription factor [Francisellaceae bacterium]